MQRWSHETTILSLVDQNMNLNIFTIQKYQNILKLKIKSNMKKNKANIHFVFKLNIK